MSHAPTSHGSASSHGGSLVRTGLGATAAIGADTFLTGGKITSGIYNAGAKVVDAIAGNVGNIVSGTPANINTPIIANTNAAPILGSASTLVDVGTGTYSLYRGYKKTREHGIVRGIQEGSFAFGAITGLTAIAGLTATSALTTPALAIGAGIWGTRQMYHGAKSFIEAPVANTLYPFKWSGNAVKKIFKGKGGGHTPAAAAH